MADKTMKTMQGPSTEIDPVYSLAESVRKVSGGTAAPPASAPEKKSAKAAKTKTLPKMRASKSGVTKITKITKTKAPARAKIDVSGSRESEKDGSEDEFIEIPPGLFWKFSTIALAILVIWSYFFR